MFYGLVTPPSNTHQDFEDGDFVMAYHVSRLPVLESSRSLLRRFQLVEVIPQDAADAKVDAYLNAEFAAGRTASKEYPYELAEDDPGSPGSKRAGRRSYKQVDFSGIDPARMARINDKSFVEPIIVAADVVVKTKTTRVDEVVAIR